MKKIIIQPKDEFSIMTDMLIVLTVLSAMAIYYYGLRAAVIILISAAVCMSADFICLKLRRKKIDAHDLSALITALVLSLMMSAAAPYYAAVIAALFAIIIGKHAFGGHRHEIFNCAAAGFMFASLNFPGTMLLYPKPFSYPSAAEAVAAETQLYPSMTKAVTETDSGEANVMDILIGKFCGPMGTGFIILLIIAAVFLMLRRSVSAVTFFTELLTVFGFAFIYYGYDLIKTFTFLSSGMMIFGMLFLSCEFSTIPKTYSSRFIYGLITAVLILVFHFYAKAENAVVYAVIIAAPFGIELDRKALSFADILNKKGPAAKLKKRLDPNLNGLEETITLINGSDDNERADKNSGGK